MRLFTEISVRTDKRNQMKDITRQIMAGLDIQDVDHGALVVFVPHTTAGVTINENADPAVQRDITGRLCQISPDDPTYTHMEGNSDAHVKTTLTGSQILVPIENGKLLLGTWQGIYFCEYDGPRSRRCFGSVMRG